MLFFIISLHAFRLKEKRTDRPFVHQIHTLELFFVFLSLYFQPSAMSLSLPTPCTQLTRWSLKQLLYFTFSRKHGTEAQALLCHSETESKQLVCQKKYKREKEEGKESYFVRESSTARPARQKDYLAVALSAEQPRTSRFPIDWLGER